jgi:hypothetical protein
VTAALASPLDLTQYAEVRVCKAVDLAYDSSGGWQVVGQFIAQIDEGEGWKMRKSLDEANEAQCRADRERTVAWHGPATFGGVT